MYSFIRFDFSMKSKIRIKIMTVYTWLTRKFLYWLSVIRQGFRKYSYQFWYLLKSSFISATSSQDHSGRLKRCLCCELTDSVLKMSRRQTLGTSAVVIHLPVPIGRLCRTTANRRGGHPCLGGFTQ